MAVSAPYADFSVEEYKTRYERARRLMEKKGLDALLVTERLNYIYFTGHRSCQNPIDKIRPFVFVLPKDKDPAMIFAAYENAQVQQTVHISDIRPYGALTGQVEFIASMIRDLGLSNSRIGCEFGREQYLGINLSSFNALTSLLDGASFVDASDIFLTLRSVKSPAEISYLRKACEITAQAEYDIGKWIKVGMTEIDLAHLLRKRLIELGAEEITFLSVISPDPEYKGICPIPTMRKLEANQLLGLDVGVSYKGYCSDIARSFYIGTPPSDLLDFYRWMRHVGRTCSDLLRPGNTPRDVIEKCNELLAERNQPTMGAGRIGHGVGLESTEYPSLSDFEDIIFEPGMTFACNPNFVNKFGFVNAEDNFLVTEDAPEILSQPEATDDPLLVVG